jgi:hypothetical protein
MTAAQNGRTATVPAAIVPAINVQTSDRKSRKRIVNFPILSDKRRGRGRKFLFEKGLRGQS